MAAASSSSSFCAKSPSAKYIGGLRSEAATPMTRAPNRSAISPATRRQASFDEPIARPSMTVLYTIPCSKPWDEMLWVEMLYGVATQQHPRAPLRFEADLDQESSLPLAGICRVKRAAGRCGGDSTKSSSYQLDTRNL